MANMNTVIASTNTETTNNKENTMEKKIRTRTVVNPLTKAEALELQQFLVKHNFCIKDAKKNIRVYRYLGTKNGKMLSSKDFVYVVGADAYRSDKKKVMSDIMALSKQVFNSKRLVKNKEYTSKMNVVEEDLLINHKIAMAWDKSKTVRFRKYNHVITDTATLSPLNTYVKNNSAELRTNRIYETKDNKHLEIFRKLAKIFEEFDPTIPFSDWKSFRYVTRNGQVVAAYTKEDMNNQMVKHFAKGIQDKFDYNLNIMNADYIAEVVKSFEPAEIVED